jgi:hypothetical protein
MVEEEKQREDGRAPAPTRKVECLDALMRRFGIDSALIGVPKLARALGMGTSTLYTYMRCGTFFMPYRMVNGTPMVKVDDFIDWYLSSDGDVRPCAAASIPAPKAEPMPASSALRAIAFATPSKRGRKGAAAKAGSTHQIEFNLADVASKDAADAAVDGVVASVLAQMERQRRQPAAGGS